MVSRKSGLSTLTPRRSDVALSVNSLSRRAPATPSAALAAPCAVAFCVSVASLATTIRSISSKVGPLCVGSAPSSASPSASPPSNHFSTCIPGCLVDGRSPKSTLGIPSLFHSLSSALRAFEDTKRAIADFSLVSPLDVGSPQSLCTTSSTASMHSSNQASGSAPSAGSWCC